MQLFKKILPAILITNVTFSICANAGSLHHLYQCFPDNTLQQDNSLPLKLITYNGKPIKDIILFNWTTMNEKNVNRFELEKSIDGANFSTINKQTAKGISNSMESYNAEDFKPNAGDNYYRLKVVTNDGKVSYSKTLRIKF